MLKEFTTKYDDKFKVNHKIAKFYSYKIQNNMSKMPGNLANDKYYLNLLLENISEENYVNVYNQLIRDTGKFDIVFDFLINSLLNGQIIDYKIKIIEMINNDSEEILLKFVRENLDKIKNIDTKEQNKLFQFMSTILINIFNEDFINVLIDKQKNNIIFFTYLNTNSERIKKYIKSNSHRILDKDVNDILS